MILPVLLVGGALFLLAFVGLKDLWHTIYGLASVIGLFYGFYLLWLGLSGNDQNNFVWGCILLLVCGGLLIYLKSLAD